MNDIYTTKNDNDNNNSLKYLKRMLSKVFISIIMVLCCLISVKMDNNNKEVINNYLFKDSLEFTKINNLYKKYFGNIVPSITSNNTEQVFSSDELLSKEIEEYNDGFKVSVNKEEAICALYGGVVVFIGNKDELGNTIIIQGNNGIDYWYSNIDNTELKLYDYIENNTILGNSKDDYIYLTFTKNGKYISYEEII